MWGEYLRANQNVSLVPYFCLACCFQARHFFYTFLSPHSRHSPVGLCCLISFLLSSSSLQPESLSRSESCCVFSQKSMARRLTVPRRGSVGGAGLGGLLAGPGKRSLYGGILSFSSFPIDHWVSHLLCFCSPLLLALSSALFAPSGHTFSNQISLNPTAPFLRLVRNNSASFPARSAQTSVASPRFLRLLLLDLRRRSSSPPLSVPQWPLFSQLNQSRSQMSASTPTQSTSCGFLSLARPSRK